MRNADGVRNLRKIIDDEQNLFIIVSAMGKTTNALEKVFEGVQKGDKDLSLEHVAALREYHAGIIGDLWHGPKRLEKVDALFDELERVAVGTSPPMPNCGTIRLWRSASWCRRPSFRNTSIMPGWRTAGSTCAAASSRNSATRMRGSTSRLRSRC